MSAALDLNHLPDSYDLPKATWRLALMLGVCGAFFVIGFTAASADRGMQGWPVMAVFGVCFAAFFVVLFTRSGITLDRDGFTYQWLLGGKRYAWRDVSEFKARQAGRSRMIVFNDATKVDSPFSRFSRAMMGGYNTGIAAPFVGGKLEDACAILNAFRERALRRSA